MFRACRDHGACGSGPVPGSLASCAGWPIAAGPLGVVVWLVARSVGWSDAAGDSGRHGKIALLVGRLLDERGDQAVGLIRNPDHAAEVRAVGAEAVVCDLEAAAAEDFSGLVAGADAMVFAVGAGPGSGVARKDTVDRAAAVLMAGAAEQAGVRRFVQVSSMGAGQRPQPGRGAVWAAYIAAKTAAEDDLRARDLDWTIARPGGLAGDPRRPGSGSHCRLCRRARFPAPASLLSSPPCWITRGRGTGLLS